MARIRQARQLRPRTVSLALTIALLTAAGCAAKSDGRASAGNTVGRGRSKSAAATKDTRSARLSTLAYTAIVVDDQGVSHFAPGRISFEYEDFAPPAAPLGTSASRPAESVAFLTYPAGWYGDWHPAPRRLMVFILSGRVEVEVGDGEKRTFTVGDAILAADTSGRGHVTRTVGDVAAVSAAVAIAEDLPAR